MYIDMQNAKTVPSIPGSVDTLVLGDYKGQPFGEIPGSLVQLVVRGQSKPRLRSLKAAPASIKKVILYELNVDSVGDLPPSTEVLIIEWSTVRNLTGLPQSLKTLVISECPSLESTEGLPDSLTELWLQGVSIKTLTGLPKGLTTLELYGDNLPSTLEQLPASVKRLRLGGGRTWSPFSNSVD